MSPISTPPQQVPQRVVSLVPSLTESLFELGFGHAVVGITDYCIHPAEALADLPRLGGTKDPRIDDILQLKPDLVLANREENGRQAIESLQAAGLRLWISFPKTVAESLNDLLRLASLFLSPHAILKVRTLERGWEWTQASAPPNPQRFFCPIWYAQTQEGMPWWMTFNHQTYTHDLLTHLGGENVFAYRERRYPLEADLGLEKAQEPGERDTRYPRVTLEEIRAANPELILLPSEPYEFTEADRLDLCKLLAGTPAVENDRVHLVDGSLITWHGTRLAQAMRELPRFFTFGDN
jgi:ABC-type Fe3+-hydroxamate transport system substrate-binding protein